MEKRIIIVYKSSTGFTKKYAEIMADRLNCAIADYKVIANKRLAEYPLVIFGSRAHAGRIDGWKKIKEWHENRTIQNLVVFVTGAVPNEQSETIAQFWKQNFTEEECRKIPHFYMQGGLCYEKMSLADRLMMKTAAFMIGNKKDKNDDEKQFEQAIKSSYDISSAKYAEPLIAYIKENGNLLSIF